MIADFVKSLVLFIGPKRDIRHSALMASRAACSGRLLYWLRRPQTVKENDIRKSDSPMPFPEMTLKETATLSTNRAEQYWDRSNTVRHVIC